MVRDEQEASVDEVNTDENEFGQSKIDFIELIRLGKWNGIKFVGKMHRDSCCICTWIKTDVEIC